MFFFGLRPSFLPAKHFLQNLAEAFENSVIHSNSKADA